MLKGIHEYLSSDSIESIKLGVSLLQEIVKPSKLRSILFEYHRDAQDFPRFQFTISLKNEVHIFSLDEMDNYYTQILSNNTPHSCASVPTQTWHSMGLSNININYVHKKVSKKHSK